MHRHATLLLSFGLALSVAATAHAQPTPVPTTAVSGTCRGDRALHAPQTPAETAVDAALEQELRDRHLDATASGRTCTHVERTSGATTWSLIEWTAQAARVATQSQLAIAACVAGTCTVANTNVFTSWGAGSVARSRTIDGFDVFEGDTSYAVLRWTMRVRGGPAAENESMLGVYFVDAGQVRGFDVTSAERLFDHFELAIDVRTDATVGATLVRGEGPRATRPMERLATRPTVRALAALHAPIAHLDAL